MYIYDVKALLRSLSITFMISTPKPKIMDIVL